MPKSTDCLIVVDVQNDFCPGGALEVKHGDEIVPLVNQLARKFENVVLTQDWHTPGHVSFASSHAGKKPFETKRLRYGEQVLWPDHCIQGTRGAALHDALDVPHAQLVIRKGFHPKVDSYSGFLEADRKTKTGLDDAMIGSLPLYEFSSPVSTDRKKSFPLLKNAMVLPFGDNAGREPVKVSDLAVEGGWLLSPFGAVRSIEI